MHPYVAIGRFIFSTYSLAMLLAFVLAWRVLRTEFQRRLLPAQNADHIVIILAITGIVGSHLYHVLQSPTDFFADPIGRLFSRGGYAWYGGLLAGIVALAFLAKRFRIPFLEMMDLASPSAALGYAVGRIGCLMAGDGDYGTPTALPWGMSFPDGTRPTFERVHPTPIYECIISLAIFYYLWRLSKQERYRGFIFARYLILTGLARFLIEFIRINPKSVFGFTNAQILSLMCLTAGIFLMMVHPVGTASN